MPVQPDRARRCFALSASAVIPVSSLCPPSFGPRRFWLWLPDAQAKKPHCGFGSSGRVASTACRHSPLQRCKSPRWAVLAMQPHLRLPFALMRRRKQQLRIHRTCSHQPGRLYNTAHNLFASFEPLFESVDLK